MKILKKLFNSEDKKRLISNFLALSSLQGANFILPLISFPYLVRTLGIENFGLLVFAQATISYFNQFVDFGFKYSATREVSVNRNDSNKINEIFSSIMLIKIFFILVSFFILSLLLYYFDKFGSHRNVFLLSFLMVIGEALFPIWLFQGMEKMKYITYLNISTKLFFTISIFIFIQNPNDVEIAAFLFSLGYLIAGILGFILAYKDFHIKFILPSLGKIVYYIKDSYHFFLSRIASSFYGASNTIILGIVSNNEIVGFYAIAEKLYFALIRLYQPVSNVLYPYIANKRNLLLFKKVFFIVMVFHGVLIGVLYSFSSDIIYLISGEAIEVSVDVFKVLLVASFFTVASILLTYPYVAALGYKKEANLSSIIAAGAHICILGIVYALGLISAIYLPYILLFTEIFVFLLLVYYIGKFSLWRENI